MNILYNTYFCELCFVSPLRHTPAAPIAKTGDIQFIFHNENGKIWPSALAPHLKIVKEIHISFQYNIMCMIVTIYIFFKQIHTRTTFPFAIQ
jgi:hypothetical protein